jgi:predicted RND superfamily exporter protein
MWSNLTKFILRNKFILLVVLGLGTAFMSYEATKVQLSYEFAKILPSNNPNFIDYTQFKKAFGEDGNAIVVGIDDKDIFTLNKFNDWYDLSAEIKAMDGIQGLVSVARLFDLQKDENLKKFKINLLSTKKPSTQAELDSLKNKIKSMPFYEGLLYNKNSDVSIMLITFDKEKLNTKNRILIVKTIKDKIDAFGKKYHEDIHISGLPYIRTAISSKVAHELELFLLLGFAVTGIILLLVFRSFNPVFFSLLVVVIGVIWSLGSIALFGYNITILTGLIPPIIIIIGVPNSILLLNRYQNEYRIHGDKLLALNQTIEKVGVTTFLANVTTAIGFGVFYFTNSALLVEFGLITAINVMVTYAISLLFIPLVFSYLPPPSPKTTDHLKGRLITRFLTKVDEWVHYKQSTIYISVIVILAISLIGMTKIKTIGYVVDDLPKNDPIYVDMKFFEKHLKGVLPLEITIDTKTPDGTNNLRVLQKINRLEKVIASYPEFSKPVSIVSAIKFSYQTYRGGDKKYYVLPGVTEMASLANYTTDGSSNGTAFNTLVDSTKQVARVSVQMCDIGSVKMRPLIADLQLRIDSIFNPKYYTVKLTGNSLMFLRGNDYLLVNLKESVLLAIFLIGVVMFMLFVSFRMIFIAIIPSLIPLLITAGLMGYLGIALKPSTILVFSIAFGIASDGTMYFLSKYKQELLSNSSSISRTVSVVIAETGVSMVYVAIILFFGFSIFGASQFGGTVALGILISFTLLVAMCSNLILLPCFLISLERKVNNEAFLSESLIYTYDEEEDIDLDSLEIRREINKDKNKDNK